MYVVYQLQPSYTNGVDSPTRNAPWSPDSGLHVSRWLVCLNSGYMIYSIA